MQKSIKKIKITGDNWKWKTMIQIVGSSKSSKREDYTGIILPLERRKISNKQFMYKTTWEKNKLKDNETTKWVLRKNNDHRGNK